MLRMRDEQLNALEAPVLDEFIDDMVLHAHEHFPEECTTLGIEGVRARVEDGIRNAAGYGVVSPRGVCKYINMVMLFGPDFDTNPQSASWVQPILKDDTIVDPNVRMDVLGDKALSVVEQAENINSEASGEPQE